MNASPYGKSTRIKDPQREAGGVALHQPTLCVEVFMAGDAGRARQIARDFCNAAPCCVTVTETTYVYAGGEESGFVIAFRNYPRFPSDVRSLRSLACDLAEQLRSKLSQRSYMISEHGGTTTWRSTNA